MIAQESASIPIAPSLESSLPPPALLDARVAWICCISAELGAAAVLCARALVLAVAAVTNLAFFGRLSFAPADPAKNSLGLWVVLIPVVGGALVGIMARFGSRAIRGHGIPEAMEQVLTNESRIPPLITLLKPLSSAVAIGTGGPFGAEGPIIATGGALGSLVGQLLSTTAIERKALLSAGAAAGMTAIFGTPLAAVALAIELLLFEFRPRTLLPVAVGCAAAAGLRPAFFESGPVFPMQPFHAVGPQSLIAYTLVGALVGVASVGVTRLVYWIEDRFETLPLHWAMWPALAGFAVGVVGYLAPRTLGVGYVNISDIVQGRLVGPALVILLLAKLISWSVALGSGTSGGTLAPLLTIGGGLGACIGVACSGFLGVDPRVAGLIGMAAMFAGASRALLASVVFAFEATGRPEALLPLLAGCSAAYLLSSLMMRTTIMTEKIERRGVRVPTEYVADFLAGIPASSVGLRHVSTLKENQTLEEIRDWLESPDPEAHHGGFPVIDVLGTVIGVVSRKTLLDRRITGEVRLGDVVERRAITLGPTASLRAAADLMVTEGVGRLPLVDPYGALVGIVSRSDLLAAHAPRLRHHLDRKQSIRLATQRGELLIAAQPKE